MACCDDDCAIEALRERQSSTLKIVLGINVMMFVAGIGAGIYAGSSSLLSDSLDNLGDATTYGLSLYVVYKSSQAKAQVALFKGGLILLAALVVLGQVIYNSTLAGSFIRCVKKESVFSPTERSIVMLLSLLSTVIPFSGKPSVSTWSPISVFNTSTFVCHSNRRLLKESKKLIQSALFISLFILFPRDS